MGPRHGSGPPTHRPERRAHVYKLVSYQQWLSDALSCLPCFPLASKGPLLEAPFQPVEDQGGDGKCPPLNGTGGTSQPVSSRRASILDGSQQQRVRGVCQLLPFPPRSSLSHSFLYPLPRPESRPPDGLSRLCLFEAMETYSSFFLSLWGRSRAGTQPQSNDVMKWC